MFFDYSLGDRLALPMNRYVYIEKALEWYHSVYDRTGILPGAYQLEAAAFGAANNLVVAFDVGLGKTLAAFGAVETVEQIIDVSVAAFVVPAHLTSQWVSEMRKWTTGHDVYILQGTRKLTVNRVRFSGARVILEEVSSPSDRYWLLVSQESLRVWGRLILEAGSGDLFIPSGDLERELAVLGFARVPQVLVIDEVHRLYNHRSQLSRVALGLARRAQRVIVLSGTPLKGGVPKLWPLTQLVQSGFSRSHHDYLKDYCAAAQDRWGAWVPGPDHAVDPARRAQLEGFLQFYVLRYRRDQVRRSGPTHDKQRVLVPVSSEDARRLDKRIDGLKKRLRRAGQDKADISFLSGEISGIRQSIAELKIGSAVEQCRDLTGEGARVVVWCWHRAIAQKVRETIGEAAFKVDGSMTQGAREAEVLIWSETPGAVLAATFSSMGTGQDLLAPHCSTQLVLELPWDAEDLLQMLGRLDRLSQKSSRVLSILLELQVDFEKSLLDRILQAAESSDELIGDSKAEFVNALLGLDVSGWDLDRLLAGLE